MNNVGTQASDDDELQRQVDELTGVCDQVPACRGSALYQLSWLGSISAFYIALFMVPYLWCHIYRVPVAVRCGRAHSGVGSCLPAHALWFVRV